ncbi:MAG: hypothetical protein ACP5VS_16360, partial [Desulfomonilaceae bacterium]
MRKVTLIFSIITLVALFALNLRAENKSPKLIVVKPPASKTSDEPQNADAAPTLDGQFAAPSPR